MPDWPVEGPYAIYAGESIAEALERCAVGGCGGWRKPSDPYGGPRDPVLEAWVRQAVWNGGPARIPTHITGRPNGTAPTPPGAPFLMLPVVDDALDVATLLIPGLLPARRHALTQAIAAACDLFTARPILRPGKGRRPATPRTMAWIPGIRRHSHACRPIMGGGIMLPAVGRDGNAWREIDMDAFISLWPTITIMYAATMRADPTLRDTLGRHGLRLDPHLGIPRLGDTVDTWIRLADECARRKVELIAAALDGTGTDLGPCPTEGPGKDPLRIQFEKGGPWLADAFAALDGDTLDGIDRRIAEEVLGGTLPDPRDDAALRTIWLRAMGNPTSPATCDGHGEGATPAARADTSRLTETVTGRLGERDGRWFSQADIERETWAAIAAADITGDRYEVGALADTVRGQTLDRCASKGRRPSNYWARSLTIQRAKAE